MKRVILIIIVLAALVLAGCADNEDRDTLVIGERFFVNQVFEIFFNHQQYIGRTIQYEGMFRAIPLDERHFFVVYRHMLGCCGEEDIIGFEVILGDIAPFPDNTWVEVTGTLEMYGGFLVVRAASIVEMDERGAEFVF